MLTAIALGLAQGARHSLEPDHLAAVSVLVGESRELRRSAWLGVVWGLGHTASLVALAIAVLGFGALLPDAANAVFELLVAAMLIVLGVRSLRHAHHHDGERPVRSPLQALAVGAIHGLAGSSALIALVFAALPTHEERVLYLVLFGIGSVLGMAAVSAAAGAWLERLRHSRLLRALLFAIAAWSIGLGIATALRVVV